MRDRGRSWSLRARVGLAYVVTTMGAAAAMAQPPGEPGGPIEETWRYLVDMFRMLLGL